MMGFFIKFSKNLHIFNKRRYISIRNSYILVFQKWESNEQGRINGLLKCNLPKKGNNNEQNYWY